jgi:hypothetical protein
MSLDGTYGFVYCGSTGLGIGAFVVNDIKVVGCDYSGGRYSGSLTEDTAGNLLLDVTFVVAAGTTVVQGAAAQDIPYARPLKHTFPPGGFGDGTPQKIGVPPGEVTVMVKRIPDEFAVAAIDGFTLEIARRIS